MHDLNMLHQGSDVAGPLRIRVYFTDSRFIFRYQELREHIASLNLGDDGGVRGERPTEHQVETSLGM